jgi:S-adenosylmethionine:tRNA ribosyltransferase-isomerase
MKTDYRPEDFDYDLPEEAIALHPAERRDASRLLHYKGGLITDHAFSDVVGLLPPGSQLILNNTRVIHARLIGHKSTGGKVEIFLLRPADDAVDHAMRATGLTHWMCLVGGAKRWKDGHVTIQSEDVTVHASLVEKRGDEFLVALEWKPSGMPFAEVLEHAGRIPLPPYIHREANESDRLRYQTAFAEKLGSVAAPTAGLHFTDEILRSLSVDQVKLTLHVSAGTFKPMSVDAIFDHEMHEEQCEVERSAIEMLSRAGKKYAVGTTSLRTLESVYWLAEKWRREGKMPRFIDQYEPYKVEPQFADFNEAMAWLHTALGEEKLDRYGFETSIMIAPGYNLRSIDGIFTNFHMPKSTLLLLVHAIIGDDWRRVYSHALSSGYRFLSYGDSSLLERS